MEPARNQLDQRALAGVGLVPVDDPERRCQKVVNPGPVRHLTGDARDVVIPPEALSPYIIVNVLGFAPRFIGVGKGHQIDWESDIRCAGAR